MAALPADKRMLMASTGEYFVGEIAIDELWSKRTPAIAVNFVPKRIFYFGRMLQESSPSRSFSASPSKRWRRVLLALLPVLEKLSHWRAAPGNHGWRSNLPTNCADESNWSQNRWAIEILLIEVVEHQMLPYWASSWCIEAEDMKAILVPCSWLRMKACFINPH